MNNTNTAVNPATRKRASQRRWPRFPLHPVRAIQEMCAVCHGNDLKGNGPAPPPFQDVPPDLTKLAQRNGGNFPDVYVINVLRHGVVLPAHGPAEMPDWGPEFRAGEGLDDDSSKRQRMHKPERLHQVSSSKIRR